MTIPYYYGAVKIKQAPLADIIAKMVCQQEEWLATTRSYLNGFAAQRILFSKTAFMLAYCYDQAYGTMSWGNWLRLPLEFAWDCELKDHEMALTSDPEIGVDAIFGGNGTPVASLVPNVLNLVKKEL